MFTSDLGFENLLWFIGIVEDNNDPTNNGRARVRCFGIHPPVDTNEVPTEALPWAVQVNGTYGGVVKQPGIAEWVFGFFLDGREAQHPMLLGTIPGMNSALPAGSPHPAAHRYVKPSTEAVENFGNPPIPPQMSGEDLEITPIVPASSSIGSGRAPDDQGWTTPIPAVGGQSGKHSVWQTTYNGSYVELNGTEDSEHITIMHKTGSYIYVDSVGNVTINNTGDRYEDSSGHSNERIEGRKNICVSGDFTINVLEGSTTIQSKGDINFITNNDFNFNVGGKMVMNVSEGIQMRGASIALQSHSDNINIYAEKTLKMFSNENMSLSTFKEFRLASGTGVSVKTPATIGITANGNIGVVSSDAGVHVSSKTDLNMKSEAELSIQGTTVNIDDNVSMANGDANDPVSVTTNPAEPVATPDIPDPVGRAAIGAQAPVTTSTQQGGLLSTDDSNLA